MLLIGLQGSYARGEATEQSDLDVVLILDRVIMADCLAGDDLAVLRQSGDTMEEQTAILLAWAGAG